MIGLDLQGWILFALAMLFFTAIVVSACGWLLVWRTRRPPDEMAGPDDEQTPQLGPANPLR